LSIVKHAVDRHGGDVRLWSRPGQGSTFTIRLPQAEAPPKNPHKRKARSRAASESAAAPAAVSNGEPR